MFKCDNCGGKVVVRTTTDISRSVDVKIITEDKEIVCDNPVFDYSNCETLGFFCKDCRKPLISEYGTRIKTAKQLINFLKGE